MEFLEDLLDTDGIAAVKGHATGQMQKKQALKLLSKALKDLARRTEKEKKRTSTTRESRSIVGGSGTGGGRGGGTSSRKPHPSGAFPFSRAVQRSSESEV